MTRKHYYKLAEVLNEALMEFPYEDQYSRSVVVGIAERLCPMLLADNPRFDRKIFLDAVERGTK